MKIRKLLLVFCSIVCSILPCLGKNDSLISIAVYPIKSAVLSDVFTETLTENIESRLLTEKKYNVIARSNRDVLIAEEELIKTGIVHERDPDKNGGMILPVDKIVTGSVNRIGKSFSFILKILDTRSGRIEKALQKTYYGSEEGLLVISTTLVDSLCCKPPEESVQKKKISTKIRMLNSDHQFPVNSNEPLEKEVNSKKNESAVPNKGLNSERLSLKVTSATNINERSSLGRQIGIGALVIFCILTATVLSTRIN